MRFALAALVALALWPAGAPAAEPPEREGPPLSVSPAALASTFSCAGDLHGATRDPVLLTPAFSSAQVSYGWNYLARLPRIGVPVCTVSLPGEGYDDLQEAAEHVVFAVRAMRRASGRKVVVLGHQHGALDELWAITYWPDVARSVSDLVSLATPYRGTAAARDLCRASCAAATRQIAAGSNYLAALNRAPLAAGPSYTSIASLTDALITPQPEASNLSSARNVTVQDVCPGRQVSHFEILADAVAYRLVMDAIDHPGPAELSRIPSSVCAERLMPDADPVTLSLANGFLPIFAANNVSRAAPEPSVRPYAERRPPRVTITTRRSKLSRRGTLGLRLGCRSVGATTCRTLVSLKLSSRRTAGSKVVRIASGSTVVVRVKVPRRARTVLKAKRRVRVRATARATDALGNAALTTRRVLARR